MYKVYVGCLPASCTPNMLASYFAQFDDIHSIKLSKRSSNKLCSGNGSFTCNYKAAFDKIVSQREFDFHGRTIYCNPLLSGDELLQKNQELSLRRIFLSNLAPDVTDHDLLNLMAEFGGVENAYKIKNLKGEPKPFGFVTFFSPSSAEKAVKAKRINFKDFFIDISEYTKNSRSKRQSKKILGSSDVFHSKTSSLHQKSAVSNQSKSDELQAKIQKRHWKALEHHQGVHAKPTSNSYHTARKVILKKPQELLRFNVRAPPNLGAEANFNRYRTPPGL